MLKLGMRIPKPTGKQRIFAIDYEAHLTGAVLFWGLSVCVALAGLRMAILAKKSYFQFLAKPGSDFFNAF